MSGRLRARPAALLVLTMLAALAAGCAAPARRGDPAALAAQERREARLAGIDHWGFVGRIAVFDGTDNGSGRIEWRQAGDRFEILLSAPVSRQSWRLSGGPGDALLEGLEGGPRRASSAEALLRREVGWTVPLARLRAWARGLAGSDDGRLLFGTTGLPAGLEEDGWTVQYRDWHAGLEPPLPRRVFAHNGERRVRLAIERWLPAAEVAVAAPDGGRPRP